MFRPAVKNDVRSLSPLLASDQVVIVSSCECTFFHFSIETSGVDEVLVVVNFSEQGRDVLLGVSSYRDVEVSVELLHSL